MLKRWAPEVWQFFGDGPAILVGCKKDLRCDAKAKAVDGLSRAAEECQF
jgi:hypothetical protein